MHYMAKLSNERVDKVYRLSQSVVEQAGGLALNSDGQQRADLASGRYSEGGQADMGHSKCSELRRVACFNGSPDLQAGHCQAPNSNFAREGHGW
jgi:hypothetical protein